MAHCVDSGVPAIEMPSSVPSLAVPRYALCRAGEDHPDVQGRLGCTASDWWWLHSLHPPRMWPCSQTRGHSRRTRSAIRASAAQAFWRWI